MVHAIHDALRAAALDRAVLLANHVLSGEPVALQRLRPHAGRVVRVQAQGWPAHLPPLAPVEVRLTPAGLLERVGPGEVQVAEPDLHLGVDASNPALLAWRLATGERPSIQVQGDAALAADVDWVVAQVRWDLTADLERVLGPGPAQMLAALAGQLVRALREARQAWPGTPAAGAPPAGPGPGRPGGPDRPGGVP